MDFDFICFILYKINRTVQKKNQLRIVQYIKKKENTQETKVIEESSLANRIIRF